MAKPMTFEERRRWCEEHRGLRECVIAGMFAHLNQTEREDWRHRLLDPEYQMPVFEPLHAVEFRKRALGALAELDVLEAIDQQPDDLAEAVAGHLLNRVTENETAEIQTLLAIKAHALQIFASLDSLSEVLADMARTMSAAAADDYLDRQLSLMACAVRGCESEFPSIGFAINVCLRDRVKARLAGWTPPPGYRVHHGGV